MYFGSVKFFKHLIVLAMVLVGMLVLLLVFRITSLFFKTAGLPAPATMSPVLNVADIDPFYISSLPAIETTGENSASQHITSVANPVITNPETPETPVPESTNVDITLPELKGPYSHLYPDLRCMAPSEQSVREKTVYLTFDDGPSERTAEILDILKAADIKATFFVVGNPDEYSAELMRRIVREGHALGIHSYTHQYRAIYASVESYLEDFNRISELIFQNTGIRSDIFRFPGGSVNSYNRGVYRDIIREMKNRGYTYYDWNVDSFDAVKKTSPSSITETVLEQISKHSRCIALFHDSKYKHDTVEALEDIITALKEKGYAFDKITNTVQPIVFANK